MLCEQVLGKLHDFDTTGKTIEYVDIEWHEAFKKIHKKITDKGTEVGIRMDDSILARGLYQDDVIYADNEKLVVINTPPCEVIRVSLTPGHEKMSAKVCYEIGNRHAPLFWGENDTFITIYNEPMLVMLQKIHGVQAEKEVLKLDFDKRISASIHNHPNELLWRFFMSEKQFYLLQVNDALFPIGGYSHSQGLETYIQRGIVHDVDTAREYITHKIKWNLAYTELLAARLAYEAAEKKDLKELLYLEELLEASRIPMEQREAARKMGSRFAKTIEKLGLSISENGIFREYLDARKGKAVNHCCIYGVFCAEMQIPLEKALTHYLYAQTSAIVTNCVKTIPLSQTSGQQLLSGCYGEFDEILKDVMTRSEEDMCLSAPGFDIRGIQHEKLYSRLYMS